MKKFGDFQIRGTVMWCIVKEKRFIDSLVDGFVAPSVTANSCNSPEPI